MSIVCAQPGDEIKLEIGLHQKRSCKMLLAVVVLRLESCMGREVKHQSYSFIHQFVFHSNVDFKHKIRQVVV